MSVDRSDAAVTARLRQAAAFIRDRRPGRHVDMSDAAVTARLREASRLRALCLRLEKIGRDSGLAR